MLTGRLEVLLARLPLAGPLYRGHAARAKRTVCVALLGTGRWGPTSFVEWLATSACDLGCAYCGVGAGVAAPDELTTAEALALVQGVRRSGARRFMVSGGEPLLRPDVPEVMRRACTLELEVGLTTSGLHLEARWEELRGLRFYDYLTSLDGPPAFHDVRRGGTGAFARVGASLARMASAGARERTVHTTVHRGNLGELEALGRELRGSAATRWQLTPVTPTGRAALIPGLELDGAGLRDVVSFVAAWRGSPRVELGEPRGYLACLAGLRAGPAFFCGAGLTHATVMPDGTVVGCPSLHDAGLAEGSVRERPFDVLWREGFASLRTPGLPAGCAGCPHCGPCGGGCRAERQRRGSCLRDTWDAAGREARGSHG